jgi:hypothetical protein
MNNTRSNQNQGFDTLKNAFEKWETTQGEMKMTQKNESSSMMFWAKLAMVGAGGYLLWRNRFKVQRLLESTGISTPWLHGDVAESVQSGAAKVVGSVEHGVKSLTNSNSISNSVNEIKKAVV